MMHDVKLISLIFFILCLLPFEKKIIQSQFVILNRVFVNVITTLKYSYFHGIKNKERLIRRRHRNYPLNIGYWFRNRPLLDKYFSIMLPY